MLRVTQSRRAVALVIPIALVALASSCVDADAALQNEVDEYLTSYEAEYQRLFTAQQEAEWAANTRIVPGDTVNAARVRAAGEAYAAFVGSVENIERIQGYLAERERLTPLQARQLEVMLHIAADRPQTIPDVVSERIAAENEQVETLYGYQFTLRGRPVTVNELDRLIRTSTSSCCVPTSCERRCTS